MCFLNIYFNLSFISLYTKNLYIYYKSKPKPKLIAKYYRNFNVFRVD